MSGLAAAVSASDLKTLFSSFGAVSGKCVELQRLYFEHKVLYYHLRPPYTEQLLSLRRKQLLLQVSYEKSPENRIVSISRNMSHTCFRRLATALLCTIHGETFVARLVARQKLLRVWWP